MISSAYQCDRARASSAWRAARLSPLAPRSSRASRAPHRAQPRALRSDARTPSVPTQHRPAAPPAAPRAALHSYIRRHLYCCHECEREQIFTDPICSAYARRCLREKRWIWALARSSSVSSVRTRSSACCARSDCSSRRALSSALL